MSGNLTVVMQKEEKKVGQEIMSMLNTMSEEQKQDMLAFVRGVEFGRMLAERQAV